RVASWWRSFSGKLAPSTADRLCEKCGRPAVVYEYRAGREVKDAERHYCQPCAQSSLWIPNPTPRRHVNQVTGGSAEIPVEVERIVFSRSYEQTVVLRELYGQRRLSLIVGYYEATALWWTLKREPSPRPVTH